MPCYSDNDEEMTQAPKLMALALDGINITRLPIMFCTKNIILAKEVNTAISKDQEIEESAFMPANEIDAIIKKIPLRMIEKVAALTDKSESTFTKEHALPFMPWKATSMHL
ncbi:hypothetical protein MAM1_0202d07905 [Mucor ambiguus]|uniref:Uncharacterized protein n=1 Tax=Mucor ambiguus TaxID=91626 RepID=A0A0C9MLJ4_9FUNG|nr:hypothetical protein MAM1_0202d07905 [Mucor ambiguus]